MELDRYEESKSVLELIIILSLSDKPTRIIRKLQINILLNFRFS